MDGRARLARNLRRLRVARGLSQEALAVDARVATPYISGIEREVVNPTLDVMERLAAALGVDVDALVRADDPVVEPSPPLRPGRKPGNRGSGSAG